MNILKYISAFLIILAIAFACETDDDKYTFDNLSAPSNVSVLFDITTDNTGLVTMFPSADGATKFLISFGDVADETPSEYKNGEVVTHVYAEGNYTVTIQAMGLSGLITEFTEDINVSFTPPENLVINVENDLAVSKQVNISANADNAIAIEYYFGETEGEEPVLALPDETVAHIYAEAGDYDITVIAKSGAIQTLDSTFTFTVTEITGPLEAAPTPNKDQSKVISLFSDAYTDVTVDTWRTDWSQANLTEETIAGDAVKKYTALNFVGIETVTSTIDASGMTHFHIDVWSEDITTFKIKLVDFGADGAYDGGDDVEHELTYESPAQGEWVSYDIPLSDFTGLTTTGHIAQYIMVGAPSGANSIYIDNVYFYDDKGAPTEPTTAAPYPNKDERNVVSLFSDYYTNVAVDTWRTSWSSGPATLEDVVIAGDDAKKYSNLGFVGIETTTNTVDASEMTHFHIDFWSADATSFKIKLVDFGADGIWGNDDVEHELTITTPEQGKWVSYDIPLSDFTGLTSTAHIAQYILSAEPWEAATIWIDNVYFYKDKPAVAAPNPTYEAANVISLFSDAYTDVTVDTWRTSWSAAATTLEELSVEGNAVKKYSSLGYVGIETTTNTVDASEMTHFHIDFWSSDATKFKIKLVDFGADGAYGGGDDAEHELTIYSPAQGQWVSYDISLSEFSGLTTTGNIAQYILSGEPYEVTTVWIDNVYFHK